MELVGDPQLSLEAAIAFIDECDTDVFADVELRSAVLSPAALTPAPAKANAAAATLTLPATAPLVIGESVSNEAQEVMAPRAKKKRVRRQKLELEYLRTLVGELEDKLGQLKRMTGSGRSLGIGASATSSPSGATTSEDDEYDCSAVCSGGGGASPASTSASSDRSCSPNGKDMDESTQPPSSVASLWMGVAERQYKERVRAEHQNQKLKAMLEAQIKLANSLEKLLTKRPSEEAIESVSNPKRVKRHWELSAENDVEIFEQQLVDVSKAHLEVDRIFSTPEFTLPGATFNDTRVKNDHECDGDGVGVSFEFLSSTTLPFNLTTAGNAFWRMVAFESIKSHSYYRRDMQVTDTLVARTYGLHINTDNVKAEFCGKHTMRRYEEEDRVVIVWKQLSEPSDVNGTKFHGLQCHETGWVVLRSAPGGATGDIPGAATTVQAFARMVPHLEDDIVDQDQELQIGALSDFVMGFHELSLAMGCQIMAELLVEEEWKTSQQFAGLTL